MILRWLLRLQTLWLYFKQDNEENVKGKRAKLVEFIPFEKAFREFPGGDFHLDLIEKVGDWIF